MNIKEGMIELKHHHLGTFIKLIDLFIEHQWLLTQKRNNQTTCLLLIEHSTTYKVGFAKKLNPDTLKHLDPTTNLL